jgi:hypothetical protein
MDSICRNSQGILGAKDGSPPSFPIYGAGNFVAVVLGWKPLAQELLDLYLPSGLLRILWDI